MIWLKGVCLLQLLCGLWEVLADLMFFAWSLCLILFNRCEMSHELFSSLKFYSSYEPKRRRAYLIFKNKIILFYFIFICFIIKHSMTFLLVTGSKLRCWRFAWIFARFTFYLPYSLFIVFFFFLLGKTP